MENKKLQVMDFLKNPKPYNMYKKVDMDEIEANLKSDNLSPMERKRLEKLYKELLLLQQDSFTDKARYLDDELKHQLRQRKLEQMKKEKEKSLHFRKLILRTGIIGLLTVSSGVGIKLYHDAKILPIKYVNENYNCMTTTVVVKEGQSITSIATDIYNKLPDDVKAIKTLEDIKNEIFARNSLKNPHHIEPGWILNVPYYELKDELEEPKVY